MLHRVMWNCYALSRIQWLSPSKLRRLQEKRLHAILHHAYAKVPLYRRKFDAVGIKPEDIRTVEDLVKLPFTTKQEIKQGMPNPSIAQGYNLGDCVKKNTSGTTGGSMPIFYDKKCWDYRVADGYYRIPRARGLNPWDKTMTVSYSMPQLDATYRGVPERRDESTRRSRGRVSLGYPISLFKRWRKNAYIAYSADEIIHDILEYQPEVLQGNASYLRLIAETMIDKGIEDFHPKALTPGGEVLDEPTRQFLESTFGCDVFNGYWANEVGSLAWECTLKEGLHIAEDFLIVEVIRDGKPVRAHEQGEIVITGLLNYAMPFIRYRMGDLGILDDKQCSCGRCFSLLKSVEGRVVDLLSLPDGTTVSPKTVMTVVQGTPGVSRYRVVQERQNKVTIELMRRLNDPDVSIDELIDRCRNVLGDEVEIDVVIGRRDNLKAKFRPVISKLTVAEEPRWTQPYQPSLQTSHRLS